MRVSRWMVALAILAVVAGLAVAGCRLFAPPSQDPSSPSQAFPRWSDRPAKPSPTMEVPPPRN